AKGEGGIGGAAPQIPVIAVGAGDSKGYVDLRLADVTAPEFGFRGREFKIDLVVQAYGLAGKSVPIYFNRGKSLIATKNIDIDRDAFEQRVTLSYTPKEVGAQSFSVTTPLLPRYAIAEHD